MNIYVASSWRNDYQQHAVAWLRAAGHEVYDFRNPSPGNHGFAWSSIDPEWQAWTTGEFIRALGSPVASFGFGCDKAALDWATAGLLVLPSGRSAHLEAGYLIGQDKPVWVWAPSPTIEPELMYLLGEGMVESLDDLPRDWRQGAL